MFGIIVVLAVAVAVLAVRTVVMRREIRSMSRQLEDLSAGRSEKKISLTLVDARLSELATQINENMELQKQLRIDTRKSEQRLKDSIAGVSHDLRTPLTAIIGYIQMLERSGLNGEQQEKATIILKKANAMRELVESFFELSVIESGQSELAEEAVNFTNIVSEAVVDFIPRFEAAELEPDVDLGNKSLYIAGDTTALGRIVQNLLSNALKYTAGRVKVALEERDGEIILTVVNEVRPDTPPDMERIFERFYTGDDCRNSGSAGLGLYIVKLLAEKMQGAVSASLENKMLSVYVVFQEEKNKQA
ncbi:sensor histidine kinase [Eubacterium callanderi]|uniref:histidine kinase n=1 Tax=Eubacterium limosum TaxID=1736 RepID=A0A6N3DAX3_EUBLI|nr:HAMP domain-containing sensor histidine kinase [Eubacterium callanderi]MBO1702633.1 HAMP domain-containing histidine kinase [Eubacterium callanderi]MDR4075845.1 HAMP domain-containing sensor histidine kinase [Eubacterium sp.]